MRITKFGHSCLLVEEGNARILIDPGSTPYVTVPKVENIDAILVTHEHQDHYNAENLKMLLADNPNAKIYTNPSVGQKLAEAKVPFEVLGHGQSINVNGTTIEGVGTWHAKILDTMPIVNNTGHLIANRFFYAGDALTLPEKPVEILAYTTLAPWMSIREALDHLKSIKPKFAFPVHDAFLQFGGPYYLLPEKTSAEMDTKWMMLEEGKVYEF